MKRELTTGEIEQKIKEFAFSGSYLYDQSMSEKLSSGLRKVPYLDPIKFYLFAGTKGLEKLRRILPETFESCQEELGSLLDLIIPLFVKGSLYSALWLDAGFICNPSRKEKYHSMSTVYIRGLAEINPAVTLETCVSDYEIIAEGEEHLGVSLSMEIIRLDGFFRRYPSSSFKLETKLMTSFQLEKKIMWLRYENGIWNINSCE